MGAAETGGGGRGWRPDTRWLVYLCAAVSLQCVCVGDEVRANTRPLTFDHRQCC